MSTQTAAPLEKARDWYEESGLGRDYAEQFIR